MIINASPEKYLVFMENLKYLNQTRNINSKLYFSKCNKVKKFEIKFHLLININEDNQISLDLLYDTYNEGKQTSGEPFNTKKSKNLTIKNEVKPEYMNMIDTILKAVIPDINILEVCYNLLFLNCIENYRKLNNILNALNAIQRKITYDLIRICKFII